MFKKYCMLSSQKLWICAMISLDILRTAIISTHCHLLLTIITCIITRKRLTGRRTPFILACHTSLRTFSKIIIHCICSIIFFLLSHNIDLRLWCFNNWPIVIWQMICYISTEPLRSEHITRLWEMIIIVI